MRVYEEAVQHSVAKQAWLVLQHLHDMSHLVPSLSPLLTSFQKGLQPLARKQPEKPQSTATKPKQSAIPQPKERGSAAAAALKYKRFTVSRPVREQLARDETAGAKDAKKPPEEKELVGKGKGQVESAEVRGVGTQEVRHGQRGTKRNSPESKMEEVFVVASFPPHLLCMTATSGGKPTDAAAQWQAQTENLLTQWERFKQHKPQKTWTFGTSACLALYDYHGTELWVYNSGQASAAWQGKFLARHDNSKTFSEAKLAYLYLV